MKLFNKTFKLLNQILFIFNKNLLKFPISSNLIILLLYYVSINLWLNPNFVFSITETVYSNAINDESIVYNNILKEIIKNKYNIPPLNETIAYMKLIDINQSDSILVKTIKTFINDKDNHELIQNSFTASYSKNYNPSRDILLQKIKELLPLKSNNIWSDDYQMQKFLEELIHYASFTSNPVFFHILAIISMNIQIKRNLMYNTNKQDDLYNLCFSKIVNSITIM